MTLRGGTTHAELWFRADTEAAISDALELMGLTSGGVPVAGCGLVHWATGSLQDGPGTNAQPWANVILYAPFDQAGVDAAKALFRDGATSGTKPGENGESQWSVRPDSSAMFETSYAGNPYPETKRMVWAV